MTVTEVHGMFTVEVKVTEEPDYEGWWGVGALLIDAAAEFHGVFFWSNDPQIEYLAHCLKAFGPEYEIRDEATDIPVPTEKGVERLRQTREFIRPRFHDQAIFEFMPVARRIEFGKSKPEGFSTKSIPARTVTHSGGST